MSTKSSSLLRANNAVDDAACPFPNDELHSNLAEKAESRQRVRALDLYLGWEFDCLVQFLHLEQSWLANRLDFRTL
jgi:hypothetical protein